jgi:hypothetical protein
VTSATSQSVCQESADLGVVPNVDANSSKVPARCDRITSWDMLVPAIRSELHIVSAAMISNMPVVGHRQCELDKYNNIRKKKQCMKYAEYAEYAKNKEYA